MACLSIFEYDYIDNVVHLQGFFRIFLKLCVKNPHCLKNVLELNMDLINPGPSAQILIPSITTEIWYNIGEDRVFDIECVARYCQKSSKHLG